MALAILVMGPLLTGPPVTPPSPEAAPRPERAIPQEAGMFALAMHDLAVPADHPGRADARPRTLAGFRILRAYPGAPPRVPHPVSDEEQMQGGCGACHTRGGWVQEWSAYAPVTPHPELTSCLQCHVPGTGSAPFAASDWRTTEWPEMGARAMAESPPRVPHPLQMRENCLACHAGPGAVREIRTTHPERTACLQCHVVGEPAHEVFTRPVDGRSSSPGGMP